MGSGQKMIFTVSHIWVDAGMKVQGQPWPRIVQVQKLQNLIFVHEASVY